MGAEAAARLSGGVGRDMKRRGEGRPPFIGDVIDAHESGRVAAAQLLVKDDQPVSAQDSMPDGQGRVRRSAALRAIGDVTHQPRPGRIGNVQNGKAAYQSDTYSRSPAAGGRWVRWAVPIVPISPTARCCPGTHHRPTSRG